MEFFFLEAPAKITGICQLKTYTGHAEESYEEVSSIDLDLEAGWNIIRYGIDQVFTSETGQVYASNFSITKLDSLPEDVSWFSIIEFD